MTSDEEDVAAILGGDADRFERIVGRYKGPLMQLAMRFTGDRSTAEEMAHVAFVSCYRALGTWQRKSAFSTWLFSIALNVYRSHLRRAQPSIPLDEELPSQTSLEETISEQQEAAIVRRAVAFLPAKYRDPLVTFYFLDADLAETAAILRLPESTVKTRLRRGRHLLAQRLERQLTRGKR
jgi:RNA polymerase sigma-70 factor (ECF subfamily)